jgi:hypothetical protein
MASGFIVLRDGRCLSLVHAIHDEVLRSIAESLDAGSPLRTWLATQIPASGDVDLDYAFVRAADGTHVTRELDLRALTDANRRLFERAAREATPLGTTHAPVDDVSRGLGRLREMLELCDQGRPPLELSDWRAEAPPCTRKIGPGWTASGDS